MLVVSPVTGLSFTCFPLYPLTVSTCFHLSSSLYLLSSHLFDRWIHHPSHLHVLSSDNSIGPLEAPPVFPLLLPSLQSLSLKGNPLGTEGFRALAESIRGGSAACLRTLDLENTGLRSEALEALCGAIKESPLRVETLNLSTNELQGRPMEQICAVLCVASLPCLRTLLMRHCLLNCTEIRRLTEVLGRGDLPHLETLDSEGNYFETILWAAFQRESCLGELGKALRKDTVPSLRNLNLKGAGGLQEAEGLEAFLSVLEAPECPPLQQGGEEGVEEYEWLQLLGEGIQGGRLGCLRKLEVPEAGAALIEVPEEPEEEGARESLFTALSQVHLPRLAELSLNRLRPTDTDMLLLAVGVKRGNLLGLRVLDLGRSMGEGGFGRVGMEELMGAVIQRQEGWPLLEELHVSGTRAGEGGACLAKALSLGKLPNLSVINLQNSALTDEAVKELADAVQRGALDKVVCLRMGRNLRVGKEAWIEFSQAIVGSQRGLPKLTDLHLDHTKFESMGESLVSVLASGKVPSLESLLIMFSLCETGMTALGDAVKGKKFPPRLDELSFFLSSASAHPVSIDPLIIAIAESEKGLPPCLSTLDLTGGRVGVESLASLAASREVGEVSKLSNLRFLTLTSCGIDDQRLKKLGEVFRAHACPELGELFLQDNKLSLEGISAFLDLLEPDSLPEVKKIAFKGNTDPEGKHSERIFLSRLSELLEKAQSAGLIKKCSFSDSDWDGISVL
uniref:Uncharacterized protein n=1 Tax=Chromera velia CCMP2878 TaxID=1169474 RepID=A0A0G4GCJ3_9ALVE|eukprot:Cvel_21161.t1-p1 / transcript=Cvel_21161.t1 / gene=Cvel_21161 / organism=Chromera_velia_CCMP2878 / gene_product=hypothetical protein / transcript_product=hypothetical protein / location=Cvel_scaffold1963:221-2959(+) / protein_length=732 / sequence_SO=supercontig / SO=protein_coding / is_pseudo=false